MEIDTGTQEALDEIEEAAAVADIVTRVELQEFLEAEIGDGEPIFLRERPVVAQMRRDDMIRAVLERVTQSTPTTPKGLGTLPSCLQYPRWFRDTSIWHVTTPPIPPRRLRRPLRSKRRSS